MKKKHAFWCQIVDIPQMESYLKLQQYLILNKPKQLKFISLFEMNSS